MLKCWKTYNQLAQIQRISECKITPILTEKELDLKWSLILIAASWR